MKKIVVICLFISFELVAFNQDFPCDYALKDKAMSQLDENAQYLKDFFVHLDAKKEGEKPPAEKYSMVLSDSTFYQFTIVSSAEFPGVGAFQIYSDDKLIGSTYNETTQRNHETFTFKCMKTAVYHMYIYFVDGKEGCAVGILAYTGKFE